MKKVAFLALLLCNYITYAQDFVYKVDFAYKTLSPSACNVFATTTKVDNLDHESTIGFPKFTGYTGTDDYYINLPCQHLSSSDVGTEYQIIFPFKKGNHYEITAQYKGTRTGSDIIPFLGFHFNETKKPINASTSCSGPKDIDINNYEFIVPSGATFSWFDPNKTCTTGVLSKDYASLSVASIPWDRNTGPAAVQIRAIEIREWCDQPALGTASNLTGALTFTTPPSYGYTLNFTPVSGAEEYLVEWYDVTNSALANTFTISGPGALNTASITSGHTYRYRVQAKGHCTAPAAFSDWSADLAPLGASCEYGPLPATLGFILQCPGCTNFTLQWPAIPGAVQYKVEYWVYNYAGVGRPKTVTSTTSTVIGSTAPSTILFGGLWTVRYRVAVDCGSGFGSFSDFSPTYGLN